MIKSICLTTLLVFFTGVNLWCEPAGNAEPVPYEKNEFPGWALDLRRGEIIFFGSLPFTFLFSALGYRTGKYAWNYLTTDSSKPIPEWNEVDRGDQLNMIYIGLGLSASIALFDWILGKIEEKNND